MMIPEVIALTDEDLRKEAAKLRGFRNIRTNEFGDCLEGYLEENDEGYGDPTEVPDYPHDIAAAWELIERLPDKTLLIHEGLEWWCQPGKSSGLRDNGADGDGLASRAITRSFVLTMTEEETE